MAKRHYLAEIICDHEGKRDKPRCSCSLVDLGWYPSVGEAVDAWIAHAVEQSRPATPLDHGEPTAEEVERASREEKARTHDYHLHDTPPANIEVAAEALYYSDEPSSANARAWECAAPRSRLYYREKARKALTAANTHRSEQ